MTPNGLDGRRWRFVASDGPRLAMIEAELSRTRAGYRDRFFAPVSLERHVEKAAAGFPISTRLDDAEAASPLVLWSFDG